MIWTGERTAKENLVLMSADEKIWAKLPLYPNEVNHASEFNWGYWGSGAAQLAYCILRSCFEIVYGFSPVDAAAKAQKYHQEFKVEYVSAWKHDTWEILSDEIDIWLGGQDV